MSLDSQKIFQEMDEVGTVVLEVKDIDWEATSIPTFDDVKVEDLAAVNYMGVHDEGSNCSENTVDSKGVDVIESVIIGSPQENIKELTFSPVSRDPLKHTPIDVKEIIKFVTAGEKALTSIEPDELKQTNASNNKMPVLNDSPSALNKRPKLDTKVKKKYSAPQKFSCNLCHLKFVSHSSLQIHTRRHMGYKPFVCEVCEQGYPSNFQLQRHMKNHTNKLEHFCGECGKGALDISTLKKHARFKHGANENTYNLYRIKEEVSEEGEKIIFIKTFRNGETNIRRFRLIDDPGHNVVSQT